MVNQLKVSVITVVYNNGKTIAYTLESFKNQTYSNKELIIIDGGSTDNTLFEIKKFGSENYILLSEPDNGIYDAINKGIGLATGDIIGILNSDDFFNDNNVISRIIESFKLNKDLQALFADVKFVNRENTNKILRHYSSQFFKPWMFKFGFQPAHPTFYAKKELFDSYGKYRTDLRIAGDFELLLRFILKNRIKYKYINDVWVKMRVGGASTSGLSSVLKLNDEIVKAHKVNNIYTNKFLVYSKYLFKWWGFIKK
jgi:glycosyltransferase involved in cell wall biosynthesis